MYNIIKENSENFFQIMVQGHKINCVIHTNFNPKNKRIYILVPGLLGDRTDSRHMFVRLARELANNNLNVLRFDYIGGGSSEGNYSENDFLLMQNTLKQIIETVTERFSWLSEIGLIAFSEAGKFCVRLSHEINNIKFIGFCNAILTEEQNYNQINRPKIINGQLVYDSNFGTWINWNVVEQYSKWFIELCELKEDVTYHAVYADSDPLTSNSLKFVEESGIKVERIKGADHLFTSQLWLNEMITLWTKKILVKELEFEVEEFFLRTYWGKQCIKYVDKGSDKLVVYVHGIGQNKSGPGFLYNQISQKIDKFSQLFFDFYGYGDSDYCAERFMKLTFKDYVEQLRDILDYINKIHPYKKLLLIGTGIGCGIIDEFSRMNTEIVLEMIYLFPQISEIWDRLDISDKMREEIDTYYIYQKYLWAEEEFCKLGNVSNRIRGMNLSVGFLKELSNIELQELYSNGLVYIGNNIKKKVEINDDSCLLMRSSARDKVITDIISIVENGVC